MSFVHLPLGQRIPSSPHAVSCSMPTLRDVRGYEEKDPATMRQLTSGYPRFVVHPFTRQLVAHFQARDPQLSDRVLWLTSSAKMAKRLHAFLGEAAGARLFADDGLHGVSHAAAPAEIGARAKTLLQNIGGFLSSREAEDELVRRGLVSQRHHEATYAGDATAEVRRVLGKAFPECAPGDLLLTNSGMNAVFAAYAASAEIQAARGRTVWLQLGWLYLDTIAILTRFAPKSSDYVYLRDPLDFAAIERIFKKFGGRIAGIIAELPTNPLIETPDVAALGALCRGAGAHLILDSSVTSAFNVDVLKYADVVVCSLTKYTASEGDLTAGLVAINPASRDAAELRRGSAAALEPLYGRDVARLAAQIGDTEAVLAKIHANTARVAAFLSAHPNVGEVYWALQPSSRDNYRRIARHPDAGGGMISFTVRGPMEKFYDALRLPKGPSFGMKTTLICAYMYLAHYDLVTTPAGIAELAASRLDPDLLRLCVGTEPADEIIAALDEALRA